VTAGGSDARVGERRVDACWHVDHPKHALMSAKNAAGILNVEDPVAKISVDDRAGSCGGSGLDVVIMRLSEWRDNETALKVDGGFRRTHFFRSEYTAHTVHRSIDEALAVEPMTVNELDDRTGRGNWKWSLIPLRARASGYEHRHHYKEQTFLQS
jgi:hypothetical protein